MKNSVNEHHNLLLGDPPETISEQITIVLWGVTNESMAEWAKIRKISDPEKITEFSGFAGSPGKREGIARVCRTVKEIEQLQEGEILVAPITSPSWLRHVKG